MRGVDCRIFFMHCRSLSAIISLFVAARIIAQEAAEPPVKLAEVVVTPSHFGVAEERPAVAASLTSTELEVLPQIGDDLFRSIARLPGLAADDVSARFWIRGAPHQQLLARLDGVDLIEPFHLKDIDGAVSIIDPAVIEQLDLSTGGFGAEYADRMAGVLTMETKSNVRSLTALELSLTGVGARHEGAWSGGRERWFATARRGYPDVALHLAGRNKDVSPRFYDVMAKAEYEVAPQQKVSIHALHAGDAFRYRRTNDPSLSSTYDSDYVWARWRGRVSAALAGEAVLSWTQLAWNRSGDGRLDSFPFSLHDRRRLDVIAVRNEWTLNLSDNAIVRGGIEGSNGDARYDYALSHQYTTVSGGAQVVAVQAVNATARPRGDTLGAFTALRVRPWSNLVVEPGIRFDRHNYSGDREVNPRVNAAWTFGRTTLRMAWGEYSQAQGLQQLDIAEGDTHFHRAERAEHRVLGVERSLGHGVLLRLEAYERLTTRVRPHWVNLDEPYDLFPEAQSDRVLLAPDRARARGVELWLSSRAGTRWRWNVSYALARTEEHLLGAWVPRARDERHAFYSDVTYVLNAKWQLSAAWQYHTGWPTTDVVYSLAPLSNGRRLLVSANGPIYGLRLPDYHRLDLRATRRIALKHGELRVFIDIFNAYDRVNLMGYNHDVVVSGSTVTNTKTPREQLPFLPSVGVVWEF